MKRVGFFKKSEKRILSKTLYSKIWGEIENPGTLMGTQTFIRNDHPGDTIHVDPTSCYYESHFVSLP